MHDRVTHYELAGEYDSKIFSQSIYNLYTAQTHICGHTGKDCVHLDQSAVLNGVNCVRAYVED